MIPSDVVYTQAIRAKELEFLLERVKPHSRILEIGAGSGYQASQIAAAGHHVDAVDVQLWNKPLYPITLFDGCKLPFEDDWFDYIFSSNVLKHVVELDVLEVEIGRVLKNGGLAIHIVPTHMWRFWTTLTYYPALPKIVLGAVQHLRRGKTDSQISTKFGPEMVCGSAPVLETLSKFKRYMKWIGTLLMSPRHGERGNRLTEFFISGLPGG